MKLTVAKGTWILGTSEFLLEWQIMESKLRADLLGFFLPAPASKSAEFVQWPCVIAVEKEDFL